MNETNRDQSMTTGAPKLAEAAAHISHRFHMRRWLRNVSIVGCVAVLAVGSYQMFVKTAAIVYITINPHISMELNRLGDVTELTALNADGFTLLDGYDAQGKSSVAVTHALIDRAQALGLFTEEGQVTISIETDSTALTEQYDAEFSQSLSSEMVPVTIRAMLPIRAMKSIAMEYFGLSHISFDEITCAAEHDQAIYTVKLHKGSAEYECRIDAVTGEVLNSEEDAGEQAASSDSLLLQEDTQSLSNNSVTDSTANNSSPAENMTAEQVKEIALNRAGLTTATFSMVEQITIHDASAWKLKFYTDTGDYYCIVNATTGAIMEYEGNDKESGHEQGDASAAVSAAVEITEAKARTIALNHAGVTTADFEKIKLDTDGGKAVYKLEFTAGSWDYECKLDAASGTILEWDADEHH